MVDVVEVRMWGKQVGAVAFDPSADCYAFGYAKGWKRENVEISPLQMPYREQPYVFPALGRDTYRGLPGLLADALPDAWGNALVDAYLQHKGRRKEDISVLDRLSYMGKRGLGALEFRPATGAPVATEEVIEMQSMVELARLAVRGDLSDERVAGAELARIINVGTSAGGARAKAVVAWNDVTQEMRSGQFDVPPGFDHWLLKFDGMGKDRELGGTEHYGRIEYAYYLMATNAGISMSPSRLLEENGRAHFMTRRFDREKGLKHHVQTLCGLDHLDFKQKAVHAYEQAFQVVARLNLGPDAVDELFRRMAFNVMARNCDDHTKNLAFMLKQGHAWELAPAYDVIFAHSPTGEWTAQHQMSVNGRFDAIRREDLLVVAERFGVRRPEELLLRVRSAVEAFGIFATQAGLPSKVVRALKPEFQLL